MERTTSAASPNNFIRRPTVEAIFEDFSSRRATIARALTTDQEELYALCDPACEEYLCLFGHADGGWEVKSPELLVPTELAEPTLGINLWRNAMGRVDWLASVAVRSDAWLVSVAFFLGLLLNANERMRLFTMINELPTVYETFAGFSSCILTIKQVEQRHASGASGSAQNAHDLPVGGIHIKSKEPANETSGQKQRREHEYLIFFTPFGKPAP